MSAGNVTRAGRRDGNVAAQRFGDDLMKLKRGPRWRVAFTFVMSFFDEPAVRIDIAKQLSGARCDSIKELHADREIRAVDQSAIVIGHRALNVRELRQPTGRTYDDRNLGASASLSVLRYSFSDGKVDGYIASMQRLREILDAATRVVNIQCQRDFVTLLNGQPADQLTHRAVSD